MLRRILHALLSYKDETLLETARWELNVRKIPEKHRWGYASHETRVSSFGQTHVFQPSTSGLCGVIMHERRCYAGLYLCICLQSTGLCARALKPMTFSSECS